MKRDRVRNSSLESWQIDAEKLDEGVTAYGGLPMVIETWYGLKLHKACERHVKLRERQKGLSDAEWAEVTTMLLMAGGRSVEDVESLKADMPYITPKLIVFAMRRWSAVTSSTSVPKINAAVCLWMSTPSRKAFWRASSPERWASTTSSICE